MTAEPTDRIYYRINGWDDCFETAKSRTIDRKSWGAHPLKHGAGYCRLMAMKTGPASYGVFIALASIVHARPKDKRTQGYLTDTGGIPGYPYDEEDMAAMTRMPVKVIRQGIADLLKIRWISKCNSQGKMTKDTPRILGGYHEDTSVDRGIPYTENTEDTENTDKRADARAAFDAFWEGVPNKIGKGKAREAYLKAIKNGATPDEIAGGLPGYHSYESKRACSPDYRPLFPSTWLNGERWTDELQTSKSKPESTAFSIMVRYSDNRQPTHHTIADAAQLAETVEMMHLVTIPPEEWGIPGQAEYYLDVEMEL